MEQATITENHSAGKDEAETTVQRLLKFSDYCHVGPGADRCDEAETGTCQDPFHDHFYCRLPNQFQQAEIREHALASKARRTRQLHDPETDSYAILQGDMDVLRRADDKEALVNEIMAKDWWRHYMDAAKEVEAQEDFAHIQKDQERYNELREMPEDERPEEEFKELERHIAKFNEAVEKGAEASREPERASLMEQSVDDLIKHIREDRIEVEGNNAFMQVYALHQMFMGTLKPVENGRPREQAFASVKDLGSADPEVVEALAATFRDLEQALRDGEQGNS